MAEGCKPNPGDNPLALPVLFSHITDVKTIDEAGLAYRKMTKTEDDKIVLTRLLSKSNLTDKEAIRTALDNQVKQDFKTDKVITVSGWVLSLTEARQCALFSILNS
jgi:hypothetical protein